MARLFGFSIEDNEDKSKGIVSPVPPTNEDGADFYVSTAFGSCLLYTSDAADE